MRKVSESSEDFILAPWPVFGQTERHRLTLPLILLNPHH